MRDMPKQEDSYQQFVRHIDRDNNMSLVRYLLAIGVMIAHFNILCGADISWFVTSYEVVCGFFVLSGFLLVYPILRGKPIKKYLVDRAWRLLPSYICIVLLCAITFCFVSTLSIKDYFFSIDFWKYLAANLTSLNFLHPTLPGVFTGMANDAVNGSLWTIKIEWQLSVTIPFVILFLRKFNFRFRQSILLIFVLSIAYKLFLLYRYSTTGSEIYLILGRQFVGQLIYFYSGVMLYTYYDSILHHLKRWLLPAIFIFLTFKFVGDGFYYHNLIYPFVLSIIIVSLSLIPHDMATRYIDGGHNISYEIYLCHYPVFQLLAYYHVKAAIGIIPTLLLGFALTIALAVLIYVSVGNLYLKRKMRS